MITKTDSAKLKALNEQVRVSVIQGVLKIIGPEHIIKILTANIEVDDLQPTGQEIVLRMTLNVYPKDT